MLNDITDPSDLEFYRTEAERYRRTILHNSKRLVLELPQTNNFFTLCRRLEFLFVKGYYKDAVDVGNQIVNEYLGKELLGDICE